MLMVTEAIVLHAFDYLETSRILRLATRSRGVVSVIARGARRSTRRFGSAMDLFARGTARIAHRDGRDLHALEAFDVTAGHAALAADLDRFMGAAMLAELTLRTASESEHGESFEVLSRALDELVEAHGEGARVAALGSAWALVSTLGVAPTTDRCARCHAAVSSDGAVPFSTAVGGVLCDLCAPGVRATRLLPSSAREHLRAWLEGAGAGSSVPGDALRAHVRLLLEFLQRHLTDEAELRAYAAWAERFPRDA